MNRRLLVLVTGLAMGTPFVATSWGQSASERTRFADRMAELRRDWAQPQAAEEPTENPAPETTRPQPAARGLVPEWIGRRGEQATNNTPAQPASDVRVTLPGLGGSPLPAGQWGAAGSAATSAGATPRPDISSELSAEFPIVREITAREPTIGNGASAVRSSPGRPATRQVDPQELSRELAGAFPVAGPPAERPAPTEPSETAAASEPTLAAPKQSLALPSADSPTWRNMPPDETPATDTRKESFSATRSAANDDHNLLVSNQTPIIATDIRGPKQILVGREAVYRVRLQNQSATPAEGIVASIRIPSWAEIIDSRTTQGTVKPTTSSDSPTQLDWQLSRLDARASETLDIRLIPRASRPLELGVSWTLAPVGSRAVVEVQEPKLNIEVTGPSEVLYDKPQVFRLTLSNPGTGPAENVRIDLVPPGGRADSATSHVLGDLPPGATKAVEIELTAREPGKLTVQASASAEGGLTASGSKDVFCRKPELEVDWRGPSQQYAGTVATYFFRVRNPGTAPAEDVTVEVTLPKDTELTTASEGHVVEAANRKVLWQVGTLGPGDDHYMELKCVMNSPGANQLQVAAATTAGDLSDNALTQTKVIALADLKLQVSDPRGPVAVGAPAVYEIQLRNRGAGAAQNVEVVGLFSDGIEPEQAEGALYTIADGRVAFRAIEEIPPGREVTLRIRARAAQPGTHVFRAEVQCRDLEIRLAAEETTRFYTEEIQLESDEAERESASTAFDPEPAEPQLR